MSSRSQLTTQRLAESPHAHRHLRRPQRHELLGQRGVGEARRPGRLDIVPEPLQHRRRGAHRRNAVLV